MIQKKLNTKILDNDSVKACAYIIDCDWRYLFQKRDNHLYDWSSNKISLFGGGVEIWETLYQWLARELFEELELKIESCTISYVGKHISSTWISFEIFEVKIMVVQNLILHEWSDIIYATKQKIYDAEFTSWFSKINAIYLDYLWI
jgi:8-oxo-dGTP pyrophosphatase MutT (NUDIX family)